MHAQHRGVQRDGSAASHAALPEGRDAASRSPRPRLELVQAQPGRQPANNRDDTTETRPPVVVRELTVGWERQDVLLVMWLGGALDQATVALLDREFDEQAIGLVGLVVDLTDLAFIDSPGLDALAGIQCRAATRGVRLAFRHGPHILPRPVELLRTVRLRSRWAASRAGVSDENFYFALAMACVDVDHPRPGDRPEAA